MVLMKENSNWLQGLGAKYNVPFYKWSWKKGNTEFMYIYDCNST